MPPQPTAAELQRRIQALEAQVNKLNAAPAALTAKQTAAQAVAAANAAIAAYNVSSAKFSSINMFSANAVIVTDSNGMPAGSTTLPSGLTIPNGILIIADQNDGHTYQLVSANGILGLEQIS
jgi:hypothetical protein